MDDFSTGPFTQTGSGGVIYLASGAIGGVRVSALTDYSGSTVPSVVSLVVGDGYLNITAGDQPDYFDIQWGTFGTYLNKLVSH